MKSSDKLMKHDRLLTKQFLYLITIPPCFMMSGALLSIAPDLFTL